MFLACPKHFPNYGINLDFHAMKRMSSRVPSATTPEFTALEEHYGAQAWPISTAGGDQRMKQHVRPPSMLGLLLLGTRESIFIFLLLKDAQNINEHLAVEHLA